MSIEFRHMHVHSCGSFLDGLSPVSEIVQRAVELGHDAVAVTDHGEVNQHLALDKECRKAGIKPIFGLEAYQTLSPDVKVKDNYHLILWALNQKGLRNIWALSSRAYLEGFYYKPRVNFDMLREHCEGVAASTACVVGVVPRHLEQGKVEEAEEYLKEYLSIFGDNFFVELHTNHMEEQKSVNVKLSELAERTGVRTTIACDSHFTYKDQWEQQRVLTAVSTGTQVGAPGGFELLPELYMMSEEEVLESLSYLPKSKVLQAMDNTVDLTRQCDVVIEQKVQIPVPPGMLKKEETPEEALLRMVEEGFERKVKSKITDKEDLDRYYERAREEFDLIVSKGFVEYFLVVAEYTRWAKSNDILVGPARGSAGGSLVAYCLDITEIDPIEYGLLFGRFLTPGRKSMPDIDLDFPPYDREKVRGHLAELYGSDHVALIGTMNRLQVKGVVKDVGKALGIPLDITSKISYRLDQVPDMNTANTEIGWDEALEKVEGIETYRQQYPHLFDMCGKLVGTIRQSSVHAAGIVISADSLTSSLPLRYRKETVSTQMVMGEVEELGFLKADILSLRNLATLQVARDLVKERHGEEIDFYRFEDEYFDDSVWDEISAGHNRGVFQLETPGLTTLSKQLKPRSLEELSVEIAVFRPGITRTGMVQEYVRRKNGESPITYLHPDLEPILRDTYGIMVYQEQIMRICMDMAGYSLEEADGVRKILGKMLYEKMKKERGTFVKRCVDRGYDFAVANKIFDVMESFGIYGFNKCARGTTTHVWLPSGRKMSLTVAYKEQPEEIMSMWPDGTVRPHKVKKYVKSGKKRCYRVKLESKYSIDVTEDHRLMTTEGYKQVRDLVIGDELITDENWMITPSCREARRRNMTKLNKSEKQRKRASERFKAYQSTLSYEDRCQHQQRVQSRHPDRNERGVLAMHEALVECWENPEWREKRVQSIEESFKQKNAIGEQRGFGRLTPLSDGRLCSSAFEAQVGEYLIGRGVEFELHRVLPGGRVCDFYADGLYWEADGLGRSNEYFAKKYGELPFVVVRPWDYKDVIEDVLMSETVSNGKKIVSITDVGEHMTYDIEMEDDGPSNFIANGIVSHNSHSLAYAMLAYWTAWMKTYYPLEYMTALFRTNDRVAAFYVKECRRLGIKVLPPDINESKARFTISKNGDAIHFGLEAVKGVGYSAVKTIEANQPFESFEDFLSRCSGKNVKSNVVEALIRVGAFDSFGLGRHQLLEKYGALKSVTTVCHYRYNKEKAEEVGLDGLSVGEGLLCTFADQEGKGELSESVEKRIARLTRPCGTKCPGYKRWVAETREVREWSPEQMARQEEELLGIALSFDPLDGLEDFIEEFQSEDVEDPEPGKKYVIGGVVTSYRSHVDKRGREMAFFDLQSPSLETLKFLAFASAYEKYGFLLRKGAVLLVEATKLEDGDGWSLIKAMRLELDEDGEVIAAS